MKQLVLAAFFGITLGQIHAQNFSTSTELIDHAYKQLQKFDGKSITGLYKPFSLAAQFNVDNPHAAEGQKQLDSFASKAGRLLRVEVCLGDRLGETIQNVCYLFVYEKGFGFVTASLVRRDNGWRTSMLQIHFEQNLEILLKKLDSQYFTHNQNAER